MLQEKKDKREKHEAPPLANPLVDSYEVCITTSSKYDVLNIMSCLYVFAL